MRKYIEVESIKQPCDVCSSLRDAIATERAYELQAHRATDYLIELLCKQEQGEMIVIDDKHVLDLITDLIDLKYDDNL